MSEIEMTEGKMNSDGEMRGIEAEWAPRIEETFQALKCADRGTQEGACQSIEKKRGGVEAGAKLRKLFETDRAKLAERAAEITAAIEKEAAVEATGKLKGQG